MQLNANSLPFDALFLNRSRSHYVFILCTMALVLSGCAQTQAFKSKSAIEGRVNPSVVLLVEPDVQLSLLTAGGLNEPHAEWTEIGKKNVNKALEDFMRERNASLIPYEKPTADPNKAHRHNQVMKMHEAVGLTIIQHKYNQALALPTKADRFDWTLGPDAKMLKQEYGADYALFVFIRDSYATAGRAAVIAVGALLGVGVQGGIQVGFASLVDLDTGEFTWFNVLVNQTGDLRTAEPARIAVDSLLTEMPF